MAEWKRGAPPSQGWWPASYHKNANMLRWWNGKRWSIAVSKWADAKMAGEHARRATEPFGRTIYWTERPSDWPERSRT